MEAGPMRELPYLEARPHLALPCRRDPAGITGPTKAEASGPGWRRVSRGRYVLAETPQTTEQRILEETLDGVRIAVLIPA